MTHDRKYYEKIIADAQTGLAALDEKSWPKKGDEHWYLRSDGKEFDGIWRGLVANNNMKKIGNLYQSRGDAKVSAEWQHLHIALHRASDGWVAGQDNWCAFLNQDNLIVYSHTEAWKRADTPYFRTKERSEDAVKTILGEDVMFYFNWKRPVY